MSRFLAADVAMSNWAQKNGFRCEWGGDSWCVEEMPHGPLVYRATAKDAVKWIENRIRIRERVALKASGNTRVGAR